MTQADAAGRKTDNARPSGGPLKAQIDSQIAAMTDGVRDAIERAVGISLGWDSSGKTRMVEFGSAARLARSSAELIAALAKLNGQFNHDINVRRVAEGKPHPTPSPQE